MGNEGLTPREIVESGEHLKPEQARDLIRAQKASQELTLTIETSKKTNANLNLQSEQIETIDEKLVEIDRSLQLEKHSLGMEKSCLGGFFKQLTPCFSSKSHRPRKPKKHKKSQKNPEKIPDPLDSTLSEIQEGLTQLTVLSQEMNQTLTEQNQDLEKINSYALEKIDSMERMEEALKNFKNSNG